MSPNDVINWCVDHYLKITSLMLNKHEDKREWSISIRMDAIGSNREYSIVRFGGTISKACTLLMDALNEGEWS